MHQREGDGWRITMDTSGPLMIALYTRDVAGLDSIGQPALSPASPKIRAADHAHLTADVGGQASLRTEWEAWWHQLLKAYPQCRPDLSPPDFASFGNSPALQKILQAHFGAALSWTRDRRSEYAGLEAEREAAGAQLLLDDLVEDRLMEVGRSARDFELNIIELPLNEKRAWYLEPNRIIMSQDLLSQPELFRSYVQPVVELLA